MNANLGKTLFTLAICAVGAAMIWTMILRPVLQPMMQFIAAW